MPLPDSTLLPPIRVTDAGTPRRVGVEIEFGEIDVDTAAELLAEVFGGEITRHTDYEITVAVPELGEFRVEVDFALLKRMGQEREAEDIVTGPLDQMSEDLLAAFARQMTPCEIVTPPLPFEKLAELDRLATRLREAGALGTKDALHYAFGVHFNPEAPSLKAASILAYLRSFVLLYDWLEAALQVDAVRRLTPFIRPFPIRYVRRILDPGYRPDVERLIDDYLAYNPTRNRALDMLPLFSHLDRERVLAVVDDPKVKSRPTYHYRLADSRVGDPDWKLTDEWRYWLIIEELAAAPDRLQTMAAEYRALLKLPLGNVFSNWADRTQEWLDQKTKNNAP